MNHIDIFIKKVSQNNPCIAGYSTSVYIYINEFKCCGRDTYHLKYLLRFYLKIKIEIIYDLKSS